MLKKIPKKKILFFIVVNSLMHFVFGMVANTYILHRNDMLNPSAKPDLLPAIMTDGVSLLILLSLGLVSLFIVLRAVKENYAEPENE